MTAPIFTAFEARTRTAFLALMDALSLPGRSFPLITPDAQARTDNAEDTMLGGLLRIGEALLDLETRFYTPVAALESELRATTALPETIPNAEYLFYPRLSEADLPDLATAAVGEMLFPDRAATIVLGCHFRDTAAAPHDQAVTIRLNGPGIQGVTDVHVSGLPESFWRLREQRRRYPLGWDLFLVDGWQVIGIPRSTHIERIG